MLNQDALSLARAEIDRIDGQIHALLLERARLVASIAAAKNGTAGLAMRPGREAQVLRARAACHEGPLPLSTVVAIWRVLMSAFTHLQTPFRVLVSDGHHAGRLRDLARLHFGAEAPIEAAEDTQALLARLDGDPWLLGVLSPDTGAAWWRAPEFARGAVKVVGGLPVLSDGSGAPTALLLGRLAPEPSGDDVTLAAARFEQAPPGALAAVRAAGVTDALIALPGFLDESEVAARLAGRGARDVVVLGACARPIPARREG